MKILTFTSIRSLSVIVLRALDATAVAYKRNCGKCHDTDQGISCVFTVTVSHQGLH